MSRSIEKPWAVYGLFTKFIGKVIQEEPDFIGIKLCERNYFSLYLKKSRIKQFKTSNEAIDYVLCNSEYLKEGLLKNLIDNFPTLMKQEAVQSLYDTLLAYQTKLISQSSP